MTGHMTTARAHVTGHMTTARAHVTGHMTTARAHMTGHLTTAGGHRLVTCSAYLKSTGNVGTNPVYSKNIQQLQKQ